MNSKAEFFRLAGSTVVIEYKNMPYFDEYLNVVVYTAL